MCVCVCVCVCVYIYICIYIYIYKCKVNRTVDILKHKRRIQFRIFRSFFNEKNFFNK